MFKDSHIRFFPIETVAAVGEVKSTLDTNSLIEALIKLAKVKKMRSIKKQTQTIVSRNKDIESHFNRYQFLIDLLLSKDKYVSTLDVTQSFFSENELNVKIIKYISPLQIWEMEKNSIAYKIQQLRKYVSSNDMEILLDQLANLIKSRDDYKYNPSHYHNDNIMTFIICKTINVVDKKNLLKKIEQAYLDENIDVKHRHNIILSIEDGLLLYYDPHSTSLSFKQQSWAFPHIENDKFEQRFIPIQAKDKEYHFKQFAHHIYNGVADTTILHPESAEYFSWEFEHEHDVIDFNSTGMKPIKKRTKSSRKPKRNNSNSKNLNKVRKKTGYKK